MIPQFEKTPKILIVSETGLWGWRLYIDGQKVEGIDELELSAGVDRVARLTVSFLAPIANVTGKKEDPS